MERPRTHLDGLPDDALMSILRSTHHVPSEWKSRTSLFFSKTSPFQTVASTMFNTVNLVAEKMIRLQPEKATLKVGVSDTSEENVHSFALEALRVCGESVKKVTLDFYHYLHPNANTSMLMKYIVKYCPNVEKVSLDGGKEDDCNLILRHFGPQLHFLKLDKHDCNLILRHFGPHLHFLKLDKQMRKHLDLSRCLNLKEFKFYGDRLTDLKPYWGNLGRVLEKVHLGCESRDSKHWVETLDQIRENCPNLTTITMDIQLNLLFALIGKERYLLFLLSYGKNLIRANVEGLQAEDFTRLCNTCPNLRLTYFVERWRDLKALRALKSHVRNLSVSLPTNIGADFGVFRGAIEQCEDIIKLTQIMAKSKTEDDDSYVHFHNENILNCTFSIPRYTIEKLSVLDVILSPISAELIAKSVSNLKHLCVTFIALIADGFIFKGIAASNLRLEHVEISENPRGRNIVNRKMEHTIRIVDQLVHCFLNCAHLAVLNLKIFPGELDYSNEVERKLVKSVRDKFRVICRPLRNRGIEHEIRMFGNLSPFTADGGGERRKW